MNPCTGGSASPISRQAIYRLFSRLGTRASEQRVSRLLAEVGKMGEDPLRLARFFGLSRLTAIRYAIAGEERGD
ncbi:MAG: hypothetical protein M3N32_04630 [Actinomycetota bacterium]|nr:hypothetical protein [Actinomycetota bacterium]